MIFYIVSVSLALFGGTFFGIFLAKLERSKATLKFKQDLKKAYDDYAENIRQLQEKDKEIFNKMAVEFQEKVLMGEVDFPTTKDGYN